MHVHNLDTSTLNLYLLHLSSLSESGAPFFTNRFKTSLQGFVFPSVGDWVYDETAAVCGTVSVFRTFEDEGSSWQCGLPTFSRQAVSKDQTHCNWLQ